MKTQATNAAKIKATPFILVLEELLLALVVVKMLVSEVIESEVIVDVLFIPEVVEAFADVDEA